MRSCRVCDAMRSIPARIIMTSVRRSAIKWLMAPSPIFEQASNVSHGSTTRFVVVGGYRHPTSTRAVTQSPTFSAEVARSHLKDQNRPTTAPPDRGNTKLVAGMSVRCRASTARGRRSSHQGHGPAPGLSILETVRRAPGPTTCRDCTETPRSCLTGHGD